MIKKQKIAIIGGGLTGLVIGYRLGQKGHKVKIFEKNSDLGGLAGGFKVNGTYLEKTYHHIFKSDKEYIALVKELGLQDKLGWHQSSMVIYYQNKLFPFVGPMDLLRFQPLGLIDRVRTGLVSLYLQKTNNWKRLVKIPAVKWMKKWGGAKAYEVIWAPLLRGKFHQYYDKVSMAWLWARIHTRGNSKSGDGKEMLGYMDGGFQVLINELAKRIRENGGKFFLNKEVKENELKKEYDKIISTAPIKGVEYLGSITVIFISEQNLSKYYWHNINDLNSPFLAFIQHTNLVDKAKYADKHVYYLGAYAPHDHQFFEISEEELKKIFFDYLIKIFKNFEENKIEKVFVFKFKNAQHVAGTNYKTPPDPHLDRGGLKSNIYHVNFAQIFPEDRGMNYAVKEAEKAVKLIET